MKKSFLTIKEMKFIENRIKDIRHHYELLINKKIDEIEHISLFKEINENLNLFKENGCSLGDTNKLTKMYKESAYPIIYEYVLNDLKQWKNRRPIGNDGMDMYGRDAAIENSYHTLSIIKAWAIENNYNITKDIIEIENNGKNKNEKV